MGPGAGNRGGTGRIWRGAALAAFVAITACSVEQRYDVLSFLFDGVPPPGSELARPPRMDDFLPPVRSQGIPPFEDLVYYRSIHQPYRERLCGECHDISEAGRPVLPDHVQCLRCHGEEFAAERWDHGPAAIAVCGVCHDPHASPGFALEVAPQPQLCTQCHADPNLMALPAHAGHEPQRCTDCHDPHRRTLRDGTSTAVAHSGPAPSWTPGPAQGRPTTSSLVYAPRQRAVWVAPGGEPR
jgi:predicted CXXCH cytochrome family protein